MNLNTLNIQELSIFDGLVENQSFNVIDEFASSLRSLMSLEVWNQISTKIFDLMLNMCLAKRISKISEIRLESKFLFS